jgi:hypothetical protein
MWWYTYVAISVIQLLDAHQRARGGHRDSTFEVIHGVRTMIYVCMYVCFMYVLLKYDITDGHAVTLLLGFCHNNVTLNNVCMYLSMCVNACTVCINASIQIDM